MILSPHSINDSPLSINKSPHAQHATPSQPFCTCSSLPSCGSPPSTSSELHLLTPTLFDSHPVASSHWVSWTLPLVCFCVHRPLRPPLPCLSFSPGGIPLIVRTQLEGHLLGEASTWLASGISSFLFCSTVTMFIIMNCGHLLSILRALLS